MLGVSEAPAHLLQNNIESSEGCRNRTDMFSEVRRGHVTSVSAEIEVVSGLQIARPLPGRSKAPADLAGSIYA